MDNIPLSPALLSASLFAGLDGNELDSFLHAAKCRMDSFPRGAILHGQGDSVTAAGVLLSGKIKAYRLNRQGEENLQSVIGPGGMFGDMLMATDNGKSPVTVECTEDAGVLYQVITARFGGETRLTDGELFTGKYELAEDKTLYVRLLREQHRRFDKAVHEMSSGDKCPKYKLRLFEELLGQLTEMRERYDTDK